ncbi:DNA-binding transcriptional MerR regulator [Paenibacillus jamilae]|jgi:DNA-binding transcriptional MerR regulator|uniref:MerR family transcriptional regulator n=1 Tax=Paenibacillus TaxID=44249 RepID=UPI000D31EBD2|nr:MULTISPECIES: MerR family transcriptional regulator [Paenibacillus]MDP9674604.1 DNA-binding transcriptional MerR regulator [Paenibacillus jamilae]KAF6617132.1 MerR family transcriptional regulator [Paenibacillus sp. EKM101P]KAF6621934.1 MerR family transcriptional regulator [Paenibacillus sp. EKM102P]KAF6631515.1 MerR family transcriptional regulator [Paenibacillus sp. EKM10P]KAF6649958.1 MerR family transcriptional regulator [Paenibacillus sp. EKM11P]
MNEKYFTPREFSDLCKVNKQTLLYYDQIGLFSPIYKNDKGYRFYSIRQLEWFNVIELLKDLGMSLKEIQQYMKHKSPASFLSLMHQQKENIVKKRKEIEMTERIIDAKIELMEEALRLDFHQISLEEHAEATLYLSKNIKNISEEDFVRVVSEFVDELYVSFLDTGYPIGGITKKEQVLKGEHTNYSYLYIKQPNPREDYPYLKTKKGYFLTGYHIGEEKSIHETYDRLFSEIDRLNLSLGDYVFEEYIYDAVVKYREKDYITKIMMEVILE